MPSTAKGFTLVELIGVIAIAGILAAVAAPRFFSANTFESRGYFDAASGLLRYAQKLAIARHGGPASASPPVKVVVDGSGLTLCLKSTGTTSSPCPTDYSTPDGERDCIEKKRSQYWLCLPDGVSQPTLPATPLSFDAQGRPDRGICLTIRGDEDLLLKIEAETGYVHKPLAPCTP